MVAVRAEHLAVALVGLVVRIPIHLLVMVAVVQEQAVLVVAEAAAEALAEALLQITQLQPTAVVAQAAQHKF
jgi:hypothetical protein